MKTIALIVMMFSASVAMAQDPTRQTGQSSAQTPAVSPTPQVSPPHIEQSAPRDDAVMFVPSGLGKEGLALVRAPDGTSGVILISEVRRALEAGYKPITVGDLVDAAGADMKLVQDLQRKISDLASDYDALVARYNRLAAINSTPAVSPQETSNDQLKRMLGLQSLFQKPPAPIQIQVTNCNATPALCVH
jgi:hypothetical protein